LQTGISGPTSYKFFSSNDDLLSAFSFFELRLLRADLTIEPVAIGLRSYWCSTRWRGASQSWSM
jgi:hypothetical protein